MVYLSQVNKPSFLFYFCGGENEGVGSKRKTGLRRDGGMSAERGASVIVLKKTTDMIQGY